MKPKIDWRAALYDNERERLAEIIAARGDGVVERRKIRHRAYQRAKRNALKEAQQ